MSGPKSQQGGFLGGLLGAASASGNPWAIAAGAILGLASGAGADAEDEALAALEKQGGEREAKEIEARARINVAIAEREGDALVSDVQSAFSAGNVDVGFGSPLLVLENTRANVEREITRIERESSFNAESARIDFQRSIDAQRARSRAANIIGAGEIVGGALRSRDVFSSTSSEEKPTESEE